MSQVEEKCKRIMSGHEDAECCICISKITSDSYFDINKRCGHAFHTRCHASAIQVAGPVDFKCPLCRGDYSTGIFRAKRWARRDVWLMATITLPVYMKNPKEHGNGRSTPAVPLKNAARPRTAAEIQRTTEKTRRDREKRLESIRKRRKCNKLCRSIFQYHSV